LAYHVAYEHFIGKRNPSLRFDHLCKNTWCVNPYHLEQVTHKINCQRGDHRTNNWCLRKTHCPKGHPYDSENTHIYKGCRKCKICVRNGCLKWHRANKKICYEKNKLWREMKKLDPIWVEKERIRNRIKNRLRRHKNHCIIPAF
jgi:hypothetical protein